MLYHIKKQRFAYWLICLAIAGMCVASCKKDNSDTVEAVRLEVFGPSPALRGSEIRFIGTGLDKIKAVVLADGTELTGITIVSTEEIRVTIPQDAVPGHITLKYDGGEIRTKTPLTYSEPISIEEVSPLRAKAGEVLTIEGEYLNLIAEIIFAQDVVVSTGDFVSQSREKIEVVVPAEAQSGIIGLSNGAEIPLIVYSEKEIDIALPSVQAPADLTERKPGDLISIAGTDLDLVKRIIVPEDIEVEFTVNADGTEISFKLPDHTTDGAVLMVPASGVKVALANIGMATISELSAMPNTEVKAGQELTIQGVNMELVIEVLFAGTTDPAPFLSQSATEVKVTVPEAAITGEITLRTNAGKTATVSIKTAKGNALSYSQNPVAAGTAFTITGQHMDLVETLTFAGDVTVAVTATSPSSLTVTVPTTAESGNIVATMKNGEQVIFPPLTVDKPLVAYIPVMPTGEIANGKLWIVTIANQDRLTGVQINGQAVQYVLDGDQLYIGIPTTVKGNSVLRLISSNGDITYNINIKDSGIVETVLWEGSVNIGWGGPTVVIPIQKFDGVRAGNFIKFYFKQLNSEGQAQINNGGWSPITGIAGGTLNKDNVGGQDAVTFEAELTQAILDNLRNNAPAWGDGMIIQGQHWTMEKVSIIDYGG